MTVGRGGKNDEITPAHDHNGFQSTGENTTDECPLFSRHAIGRWRLEVSAERRANGPLKPVGHLHLLITMAVGGVRNDNNKTEPKTVTMKR